MVFGNNSITNAYIAVAWSVTSDILDKTDISSCDCLGLDFINGIDVIKYKKNDRSRYITGTNNDELGVMETVEIVNDGSLKDNKYTIGVSAQQILNLENEYGEYGDNLIVDDSDENKLSVKYQQFVMPLINSIKELKILNDLLMARVLALENA